MIIYFSKFPNIYMYVNIINIFRQKPDTCAKVMLPRLRSEHLTKTFAADNDINPGRLAQLSHELRGLETGVTGEFLGTHVFFYHDQYN